MDDSDRRAQRVILQQLLRELRVAAQLRQVDVAYRIGQPQPFVSKYESGERRLDLIELRQICSALDVPLVELIQRFEDSV